MLKGTMTVLNGAVCTVVRSPGIMARCVDVKMQWRKSSNNRALNNVVYIVVVLPGIMLRCVDVSMMSMPCGKLTTQRSSADTSLAAAIGRTTVL